MSREPIRWDRRDPTLVVGFLGDIAILELRIAAAMSKDIWLTTLVWLLPGMPESATFSLFSVATASAEAELDAWLSRAGIVEANREI